VGEMDGDDGLDVEVEEGLILIGTAAVEVELEGDSDDVADGVLGFFGEGGWVGFGCNGGGGLSAKEWSDCQEEKHREG